MKKTHKLIMTWYLPSSVADYKTKPGNYISHVMGHEGPGSLLSALKVRNILKPRNILHGTFF